MPIGGTLGDPVVLGKFGWLSANAPSEVARGVWRLVGKFPPGFAVLFGARQIMARWAQLDEDSAKRK